MKLKDIIARLDKSEKNSDSIDIWEMAQREFDIFNLIVKEHDRLKCYYILKWVCTDTWVGSRAYFLDDVLVATSWQPARKSNENFYWQSRAAYNDTRKYLLTLTEEEDKPIELCNLDEEFGLGLPISYGAELLTDTVIYKPTSEEVAVVKKYHSMDDIKKWSIIKIKFSDGRQEEVPMTDILVPYNIIKSETTTV